jgi:hypothetical protein
MGATAAPNHLLPPARGALARVAGEFECWRRLDCFRETKNRFLSEQGSSFLFTTDTPGVGRLGFG